MADMNKTQITIGADAPAIETITVNLVGKKYKVTPPKESYSLKLARSAPQLAGLAKGDGTGFADLMENDPEKITEMVDSINDLIDGWVESAFGAKAPEIKARLDDSSDRLDTKHIMELLEAVMEYSTEDRPST